jgi:hypothetical protein
VGLPIKLAIAAALLLAVLGVGDVGARIYAQDRASHQIDQRVPGASSSVSISSFPFVAKLLMSGKVDKITAQVKHANAGQFTFDRIDVTLSGVRLNRDQLVNGQHVQVDGISVGNVRADLSELSVNKALQALGQPVVVHLVQGAADVTVSGVTVPSQLALVNNQLQIRVAGELVTVPIPRLPVLPCAATVAVIPGHLLVSCTFHQVPSAFLRLAA